MYFSVILSHKLYHVWSIDNVSLSCECVGKVGIASTKTVVADCKGDSKE